MRLPRLFRTTPFRLTLLFLALFAAAASAFLAYIYLATAGEATRRTDQNITREMRSLVAAYDRAGVDAVNQFFSLLALIRRPETMAFHERTHCPHRVQPWSRADAQSDLMRRSRSALCQ